MYTGPLWGPDWLHHMPEVVMRLRRGEVVELAGGLYALCRDCCSVVKLNKALFGSVHFCTR